MHGLFYECHVYEPINNDNNLYRFLRYRDKNHPPRMIWPRECLQDVLTEYTLLNVIPRDILNCILEYLPTEYKEEQT